jgi:AcrR family transcriptional regulator
MVTIRSKSRRAEARQQVAPRDRSATRQRILAAVGKVLARDGFSGLGINAVAREAGVDKVLLYRYFGGIEGLLDTWGRSMVMPPADTRSSTAEGSGSDGDRAAAALLRFARAAHGRPEALEVMRWELVEDNVLTRLLADVREEAGLADLRRVGIPRERAAEVDLPAVAAVLTAGLLHLSLRAKTSARWLGVPIRTRSGWSRLERAAAALVRGALAEPAPQGPKRKGARRET